MAVPTRIFVGITLFGLIATLMTATYAGLVLSCYTPPPSSPIPSPPTCDAFSVGHKVFLVLATLFSGAFTVLAWRSLLAGARMDRAKRQARQESARMGESVESEAPDEPPGYT